jgi:hypothetical protein
MRVPRIELTLTAAMLVVGATAAVAQPTHHEELAAVAASEISQAVAVSESDAGECGEEIAKAIPIEGGMTWAEVTLVRAFLASQVMEVELGKGAGVGDAWEAKSARPGGLLGVPHARSDADHDGDARCGIAAVFCA